MSNKTLNEANLFFDSFMLNPSQIRSSQDCTFIDRTPADHIPSHNTNLCSHLLEIPSDR